MQKKKNKRTLLVVTANITRSNTFLGAKFKKSFYLKDIYHVVYINKLDQIRGFTKSSLVYYDRSHYTLREIDEIKHYIENHKINSISG